MNKAREFEDFILDEYDYNLLEDWDLEYLWEWVEFEDFADLQNDFNNSHDFDPDGDTISNEDDDDDEYNDDEDDDDDDEYDDDDNDNDDNDNAEYDFNFDFDDDDDETDNHTHNNHKNDDETDTHTIESDDEEDLEGDDFLRSIGLLDDEEDNDEEEDDEYSDNEDDDEKYILGGPRFIETSAGTIDLALGDAFAVSLMTLRGFTADNFRNFHPGGKLGAKLLKVSNLMRLADDLPLVHEQTLMSEVILEITTKALGCTGVLNADNHLVGVITDGDLRRAMSDNFLCKTAGDIMTQNPMIIDAEKSAAHAVSIMERHTITGLWIVNHVKTPIGFLHLHDCLRSGVV